MDPVLLKLLAIAAGSIVSAPFVLASFRAFFFFGQMNQAVEAAKTEIGEIRKLIDSFTAEMRAAHQDVENRLTALEAAAKYGGRRAGDHPTYTPDTSL